MPFLSSPKTFYKSGLLESEAYMARHLRIQYPGAFYHVINRGAAGEGVFPDTKTREKFLEYLGLAAERFFLKIHIYCLMSNHYHLLLETPEANLSRSMQWLQVSFAAYYNRRKERKGYVFQGRFRSILVEADEYFEELSRYIHLNPVRAGMVDRPEAYQWSSYRAYIGEEDPPEWLDTGRLLSRFGKRRDSSARRYRRFVEAVDPHDLNNPDDQADAGLILGTAGFVDRVKKSLGAPLRSEGESPRYRRLREAVEPDRVVDEVAAELGCSRERIIQKGGKKNSARDLAIYLTRDLTGESAKRLGEFFGDISGAGITMRYKRMERAIEESADLRSAAEAVRSRIINI